MGTVGSTYTIWRKVSDRKRVQVVPQEFTSREDASRQMSQSPHIDRIDYRSNRIFSILCGFARKSRVIR